MDKVQNSQALRKRFNKIFQEFYLRNSVVVSAPVSFFIVGEHSVLSGSIGAKQVVPLRVYCGLHGSPGPFHITSEVVLYDRRKDEFNRTRVFEESLTEQVETNFPAIAAKKLHISVEGVEAEFLSEASLFSGLGTSGAMAAA